MSNQKYRWFALLASLSSMGCGEDGSVNSGTNHGHTVPATFTVRPGVELVTVFGAKAGASLTLYDAKQKKLLTIVSDAFGQAHFAYIPDEHLTIQSGNGTEIPSANGTTLKKGDGYVIRNDSLNPPEASAPFSVMGVHDVPDAVLYDGQVLNGIHFGIAGLPAGETEDMGFNYIEVRDGVKIGVMVRFPDPGLYGEGPYPTVIEYSGYSPSRPSDPEPGSRVATLLGYATVGVNMRGTGCSGGVFDVFNPAQHADGYDVIEVVARQPWVLHNRVGMVGLSYSGIAQLYAARTKPPSLAAITPLSVIGDSWQELYPGGIFNSGFAQQWIQERDKQASAGGQSWTAARVAGGDTICDEHQTLRNQNIDFESFFKQMVFYPSDAADRSLPKLVGEIDVPVYLTGGWQDEQTGPQFANMLDKLTGAPATKFTMYNGRHPDGYSPLVLTRWYEFLEFYVAKRVPRLSDLVRQVGGQEFSKEFGVTGLGFEPDRFPGFADGDHAGALAAYQKEPAVRVLFESGAGATDPGAPAARFEQTFASWPPPAAKAKSFYLGANGSLTDAPPSGAGGTDVYRHDPTAGGETFFGPRGYELMVPIWDIDWTEFAQGDVLSYLTEPFSSDTVVAGPGYADLYFSSEVDDVNVQVTLTEVRPDDVEFLVTSGWLKLGHRKVDESASDDLRIEHSFREADFEPLQVGQVVEAKVALPSVAHAFRQGSRLRVLISTPGRNHGTWEFTNPSYGGKTPSHSVTRTSDKPSRIYLPIAEGIQVEPGYPACPSLRGQPCRPYTAVANDSR